MSQVDVMCTGTKRCQAKCCWVAIHRRSHVSTHLIGLPSVDQKSGHAQLMAALHGARLWLLRCSTALRGVWTLQAAHISTEHPQGSPHVHV